MSHVTMTTLLLFALNAPGAAQPSAEGRPDQVLTERLVPDAAMQAKLTELCKVMCAPRTTDDEIVRHHRARQAVDSEKQIHLVRQALLFLVEPGETKVAIPVILQELHVPPDVVVEALAPFYGEKDLTIRTFVYELASYAEFSTDVDSPPNFEPYFHYIAQRGDANIPQAFLEYVFHRDPRQALLRSTTNTFGSSDQKILWAEHAIADAIWKETHKFTTAAREARPAAIEQLELLAKRKEWWARVYVAEIIRQHKELRTPELIARLEKDEHPLVRKLIAERDQKRPPPLNRPSAK